MKILFCIDSLTSGGKERRLTELMKALKGREGIEFELLLMSEEIYYKEVIQLGIKIHYVLRKRKKDLSGFKKFYRICKKSKPDIAHCWDSMTAVYLVPVTRLLGIKLINGMVVDTPVRQNVFNKDWLRARLTFRFSSLVIGNSNAGLKAYGAPKRKSACIYNGFNFDRLPKSNDAQLLREQLAIQTPYVILMVGAFEQRKDYDSYIDAALTLCKKRDDINFLAVGDGENFARLNARVDGAGENRVKLLGRRSDVESIIQLSDICVLTTNSQVHGEGISNSILEYMALGKPVIATHGGGTGEIVINEETGFLIEPGSPGELAERIERLLRDADLRKKMGTAGKERILRQFSIDSMVDQYVRIYESLLKNKSRARKAPQTSKEAKLI